MKIGGPFVVRQPDGSMHISGEVGRMRSAAKAHGHLQRQLAGADRKSSGQPLVTYEDRAEPAMW